HAGDGAVLKMDFTNFFPSIRARDWAQFCNENSVFSEEEDIAVTSRILFYRRKGSSSLRLSIGAPTSPMLSNILMRQFDERVTEKVAELSRGHITYTRYADDLTFSAPRTGYLQEVPRAVKAIVRSTRHPKLTVNSNKTVLATRKYKRFVTGLVLANDGRVTIGRDRKRTIRATVHSAMRGLLNEEQRQELLGLLAYIHSVEPAFTRKLMEWYGADFMQTLRKSLKQV
ncbi:reverse transcriptase domain-containing protein, partial [Phenylobacterium sp.]|uniref:reverse transcriptase domain-containing protein n=1 Tax=Phenylobacterium sp. TaxID=1871053 RepID=UPI002E2FBECC